jgi:hypothetical protein
MNFETIFQAALNNTLSLVFGAIGGGLLSGYITWRMLRENTARELLSEALAVQALKEAWILEGRDYQHLTLSDNREPMGEGVWLRHVEVRAVLDDATWNSPQDQCYGFIDGRRAWIVRNQLVDEPVTNSQGGPLYDHPALLSSRAFEELAGWVERVASAKYGWTLSRRGLEMLKPLLEPASREDRIIVFGDRLSLKARQFLKWYRENYAKQKSV